jgi:tetratricopeptide (TPR) repeat protein
MMRLKLSFSICFFFFIGFTFAQINPRAKEAFNKGNFEKAVSLYDKDLKKISEENPKYQSLLYNLAEAYRLSGNYRIADSIHAKVDYSKTSYWGYALTLLQQYRADKCLKFARYNLKFDAQQPELVRIEAACERIRQKVDES